MNRSFSARLLVLSAAACFAAASVPSAPAQILHHTKKPRKVSSTDPLAGVTSKQPDKELFDKAMTAMKKGKYDVARLDLQTLLNTYPESEYQMRAKLAVGDSWYKEGGTAALHQAEAEYKDFITFFPNQPEAAEAQMKVGDIYYLQMEKPDRDPTNAQRAEQEYRQMIQQFPDSTLVPAPSSACARCRKCWPSASYHRQLLRDARKLGGEHRAPADGHRLLPALQPERPGPDAAGRRLCAEASIASKMTISSPPSVSADRLLRRPRRRLLCQGGHPLSHGAPRGGRARKADRAQSPVPEPTKTELAESEAEEQSRTNIKLKDRAMLLVKHGPFTLEAARVGEPRMTPAQTSRRRRSARRTSRSSKRRRANRPARPPASAPSAAIENGTAAPRTGEPAVPNPAGNGGTGIGAEILNPNGNAGRQQQRQHHHRRESSRGCTASRRRREPGWRRICGRRRQRQLRAEGGWTGQQRSVAAGGEAGRRPDQINDVKSAPGANAQVQTGTPAPGKKQRRIPRSKPTRAPSLPA